MTLDIRESAKREILPSYQDAAWRVSEPPIHDTLRSTSHLQAIIHFNLLFI